MAIASMRSRKGTKNGSNRHVSPKYQSKPTGGVADRPLNEKVVLNSATSLSTKRPPGAVRGPPGDQRSYDFGDCNAVREPAPLRVGSGHWFHAGKQTFAPPVQVRPSPSPASPSPPSRRFGRPDRIAAW